MNPLVRDYLENDRAEWEDVTRKVFQNYERFENELRSIGDRDA